MQLDGIINRATEREIREGAPPALPGTGVVKSTSLVNGWPAALAIL
jgi:hypothetical protein